MAFYDKFPYTNFQELNLDWLTQEVSKVRDNRDASDASAAAALASEQAAAASAQASAESATEAAGSASEAAASKDASAEYLEQIGTHTAGAVADWLKDNITPTTPAIDASLTISGAAADAKKTGDAVNDLKSAFEQGILKFDDGKILSSKKLVWNTGYINNDGTIDPSTTSYSYTDKISSEELNGAVLLNVDNTIFGYRYRKNGSAIYGYRTLGSGDKLDIPDDTFEDNVDVRLVTKTAYISNIGLLAVAKTKTQTQLDNLKNDAYESPNIVMVNKVVALVGEEFDIHYDNILANCRAKDLPYKEAFGSFSGVGMEEMVRIQSSSASSGVSGALAFGKNINDAFNYSALPSVVLKKSFSVDTIAKSVGSDVTRKVLLIGDSWTAPGKYAQELRNLFEAQDEPMNITLLGTLGNGGSYVGPENGYHEGHGAYSAKTFCTKSTYNGYANAFYNPNTKTFDFSYYMNNCGYSDVDDVFVNLGINDVAEVQDYDDIIGYWNIITNSIKSYNSKIKVFIGLCGLPAQYKYGTGQNNNSNRSKARRLMLHKKLIEKYGNRESEGYIIVPLHLSIDSEHDFPTTQMARSYRDSTLVDYCTDYVHPNDIAYNKIADRIRTYIKYAETLN